MIRNVSGLAAFAFVAVVAFKILAYFFGAMIGLVFTLLWWAFLGFVIYTLLKIFAPGVAARVREVIRGPRSSSSV